MFVVGSLFTGIGGMDLAFEWAGFEIAWQVEINEFCARVLEKHWPNVPRYRDVRGVTGRLGKGWQRYRWLSPVDVMVGGFPCQDISVAGRGAGIRPGTRSGLWYEFARLIGELRPRVVLLENVAAILTRDGPSVVGALAELGYDARWGIIRASDAGAPHKRERWFCVAHANCTGLEKRKNRSKNPALLEPERGDRSNESGALEPRLGGGLDGISRGLDFPGWPAGRGRAQYEWEPPRTTEVKQSYRKQRVEALGNAVVPQVVYPIAAAIRELLENGEKRTV